MNRIFGYLLLSVITFNLGSALAGFGRQPSVLLDRNAMRVEAPEAPVPLESLKAIALPMADIQNPYEHRFRTELITERLTDDHQVAIEYPQLIDPAGRREVVFNRFLRERMRKNYAATSNQRRDEARKREGRNPVIERPLKVAYDVVYADERLISLKFLHRVARAGRVDPVDQPETINYDLARARPVTLGELFKPRSDFLLVLAAYSRAKLEGEFGPEVYVGDGTAPIESNFEHWNLSPEGLMISFDESQFYERSVGQQVVTVPYGLLWDLMGKESLIDRFGDHC